MNAQAHRLIFNQSRGGLMAVGENARSAGGASCSATRRRRRACATDTAPALVLPGSSLFSIQPASNARYLVETDPRFTDYRQWLSSDYLLSALAIDPTATQKRLGDGFYEQKLIREQIAALTGYRFLGNYTNDEAQYQALMTAGATYARAHQLRPGIALSPAQVAQLTSDIVWLVERTVSLPGQDGKPGTTTTVLAPQVYLAPRSGDLAANGQLFGAHKGGALISATQVNLALSGDVNNSATVLGRQLVAISAQNIGHSGLIQSDIALLNARQNIDIQGGQVQAHTGMLVQAGGDLSITSTTQSSTNQVGANRFSQQGIDRVAGLYVSAPAGVLLASAGGDINLSAAQLYNAGSGPTQLSAGGDINLKTVQVEQSQDINWNATNYVRQSHSAEVGSSINAGGAIQISAQNDVNLRAASVNAQGALIVGAGGQVNIEAGQSSQSLEEARQVKSKGFLSSKTTTTRSSSQSTTAQASELGGQQVFIQSGQDIRISGSNVIADQDLNIQAGRDLTIEAAQNTQSASHFNETKKSGLFSSGGLSITLGKQQQSTDQQSQQTSAAASTVGSVGGNVTLSARQTYTQSGSDVLAPGGDVNINAQTVHIQEARETSSSQFEQKFKQSGVTVALNIPVVNATQSLANTAQATAQTGSTRMQALGAATAALQAQDIARQAGQIGDALASGADLSQAADMSLSISLGASKSQSNSSQNSDTARGSSVAAGGNIHISASGADTQGEGRSDITIQGSNIQAGGTTRLSADDDIHLLAAANTTTETNSSQSSSGSIGVNISGAGISATASASRGKGQGAGNSTTHTNTQVSGQRVQIESGGDTTLKGAVVQGNQVTAQVGGNLTIESLQDSSRYNESSQSAGFSVSVPITGGNAGASVNAGKTHINSNYQSVGEQSAIRAGDGGFQVSVAGNTTLTGGQITSTEQAVQENRNSFSTGGTLTTSDLQNQANYQAKSASIGVGISAGSVSPSGVGLGSDKGSVSSSTTAGISGLAGDSAARTGDQETGIETIFDAEKVRAEIQAQVTITAEFNKQAGQLIDSYIESQRKALQEKAKNGTPEERAQAEQAIKDVNMQERALNILVGALTGMGGSILTKEALSAAAEKMRDLMIEDSKRFAGVVDSTGQVLNNISGESEGIGGDAIKLGGTRVDLDVLCGPGNERCVKNDDGTLKLDAQGRVQFDNVAAEMSMADFLKTPEGKKLVGPTGGVQGMVGTMFGVPYAAGSWVDRLVESFAGPHDYIGGGVSGLYDGQGNAKRGMTEAETTAYGIWSGVAIPIATPFAAADGVSRDVWQAVYLFLKAAQ